MPDITARTALFGKHVHVHLYCNGPRGGSLSSPTFFIATCLGPWVGIVQVSFRVNVTNRPMWAGQMHS